MALQSKIHMNALLDISDDIKFVKKRKIEKETIIYDTNMLLGQDADDTTVDLQNLEDESSLNFQDDIVNKCRCKREMEVIEVIDRCCPQ